MVRSLTYTDPGYVGVAIPEYRRTNLMLAFEETRVIEVGLGPYLGDVAVKVAQEAEARTGHFLYPSSLGECQLN